MNKSKTLLLIITFWNRSEYPLLLRVTIRIKSSAKKQLTQHVRTRTRFDGPPLPASVNRRGSWNTRNAGSAMSVSSPGRCKPPTSQGGDKITDGEVGELWYSMCLGLMPSEGNTALS